MKLDIETIELMTALRKAINSTPLEQIEIYKEGKRIEVSEKTLENFKFIGLSNCCFFEDDFYLGFEDFESSES